MAGDPLPLPKSTPWDVKRLQETTPEFEWLQREGPVRSLTYRGEPYQGHPTRVFAYYASPATVGDTSAQRPYPGIVLVHGGGGKAFSDWAELWAKHGYAAIAMDLAGCGPDGDRLPDGGPGQGDDTKFGNIDGPVTDQWTYQAVSAVILAHSWLLHTDDIDPQRTAVTGISWGGYLTCIVAGLDSRFKVAMPVYGCGFLHENSAWKVGQLDPMTPERREKWVTLWDPSQYIGSAAMPVVFLNGTNDFAYPMDSYAKTCRLVQGEKNLQHSVRNAARTHLQFPRVLSDCGPVPVRRCAAGEGRHASGGRRSCDGGSPGHAAVGLCAVALHHRSPPAKSRRGNGRLARWKFTAERFPEKHLRVTRLSGTSM